MKVLFNCNCTQRPSFGKKKSVFMGEEQAPKAQPAEVGQVPVTQPTIPTTPQQGKAPVSKEGAPVLKNQPTQDGFQKAPECKDCK